MSRAETMEQSRSTVSAVAWATLGAGLAVVAGSFIVDPTRGAAAMLTAALFSLSVCLGGGIFIATQGAANARWWLPIRMAPSLLIEALPIPAGTFAVVLLVGLSALYPWADPDAVQESVLLQGKAGWLNVPFFLARAIGVFLIWFGTLGALRSKLEKPDSGLRRSSVVFLLLLAPTISVASWDWAMSLEPEWFSTMYGVYIFSGSFLAGIAAVVVLCSFLEGTTGFPRKLDAGLRHDLGKLLFAFSCFWAYIWFCEYMLVWYSNLPEEATHFVARQSGGWTLLFWLNPLLSFIVPFVVLMPISSKRRPETLFQVATIVLFGRWLDTLLMVWPSIGPFPGFPHLALVASLAVIAAMVLLWRRRLEIR